MPMTKKPRSNCLNCGQETGRASYIYCSNQCQSDHRYHLYIQKWLEGQTSGLQRLGVVSRHVKRYLREKNNDQCSLCGWAAVNPITGVIPLVADHIDGNWRHNKEENLRLICPNCDALSATYAGLNRGNGRQGRKVSNRVIEARGISGALTPPKTVII